MKFKNFQGFSSQHARMVEVITNLFLTFDRCTCMDLVCVPREEKKRLFSPNVRDDAGNFVEKRDESSRRTIIFDRDKLRICRYYKL